jgi:hypothetical protein
MFYPPRLQILKRHWRALLPWDKSTKLTGAQRYHFVMGWLPWFADALSVVLAVLGLVWTAGLLIAPKYFDFPLSIFLAPTIAVFAFKLIRFFWLYSAKVKCDVGDCVRAGVAGRRHLHHRLRDAGRALHQEAALPPHA